MSIKDLHNVKIQFLADEKFSQTRNNHPRNFSIREDEKSRLILAVSIYYSKELQIKKNDNSSKNYLKYKVKIGKYFVTLR